ncbi:MAG: copper amine oxidase N-terminal domain-containing protein [Defluviitaleaceae bacterium]|nr:copper amine oxidase N-terminal domain-containing protein [Defluviitaleaceae bacterium]
MRKVQKLRRLVAMFLVVLMAISSFNLPIFAQEDFPESITFSDEYAGIRRETTAVSVTTPSAITIAITPQYTYALQGDTVQFYADVVALYELPECINWRVYENTSDYTVISELGLLKIAEDEVADALIVVASSDFDSTIFDTAMVVRCPYALLLAPMVAVGMIDVSPTLPHSITVAANGYVDETFIITLRNDYRSDFRLASYEIVGPNDFSHTEALSYIGGTAALAIPNPNATHNGTFYLYISYWNVNDLYDIDYNLISPTPYPNYFLLGIIELDVEALRPARLTEQIVRQIIDTPDYTFSYYGLPDVPITGYTNVLVDLRGTTGNTTFRDLSYVYALNHTITVAPDVEYLVVRGNRNAVTGIRIIVEGDTTVIVYDVALVGLPNMSVIDFTGGTNRLISFGDFTNGITGRGNSVSSVLATVTSLGSLAIDGLGALLIDHHNDGVVRSGTRGGDAINVAGSLWINFADRPAAPDSESKHPAAGMIHASSLTVRGSAGHAGVNAMSQIFAALSATAGGDGGNAVRANRIYIEDYSAVAFIGGDGGDGGRDARTFSSLHGRNGRDGNNGVNAALFRDSTNGQRGEDGTHGANAFHSAAGGHGGSAIVLGSGQHYSEALLSTAVVLAVGTGGDSIAQHGGYGGHGGRGGNAGIPNLTGGRNGGNGGNAGNAGNGGNASDAGNNGSFGFDFDGYADPSLYTGVSRAGLAGTRGRPGQGGWGSTPGGHHTDGAIERDGVRGQEGAIGSNGTAGVQNPNQDIILTWGALTPNISRIQFGVTDINDNGDRVFSTQNIFEPLQEITARITANTAGAGGPAWLAEIVNSIETDDSRFVLFHTDTDEYLELTDLYWPNQQRFFYVTFINPVNTTGQYRTDTVEARVSILYGGIFSFRAADAVAEYTNNNITWVEEVTLYRDPFDRDTGRTIMYSAAGNLDFTAYVLGCVDTDYTGYPPRHFVPSLTGLRWRIYGPDGTLLLPEQITEFDEEIGTNLLEINGSEMDVFRYPNLPELARIRLVILSEDYDIYGNPHRAYHAEYIYVSHDPPRRIRFLPWQVHVNAFHGDNAVFRFESPAHSLWMNEGLSYRVRVWRIQGDEREADFFRCEDDRDVHLFPPIKDIEISNADFELPTSDLTLSQRMPIGYRPGYLVYVSLYDPEFGWFSDYSYLFIRPQPLRVNFDRPPQTMFSDEVGSVSFPWNLQGMDVTSVISVVNSSSENVDFSYTKGVGGGLVTVNPRTVPAGTLRDIYTINITATSPFETTNPATGAQVIGEQVRTATLTFEVLNSNALIIYASNPNLTNVETIGRMTSGQILAMNRQINLTTFVQVDRRVYQWGSFDFVGWATEDADIITINRLEADGWVDIAESGSNIWGPGQSPRVIGHGTGQATVGVTHIATGITSDHIEINVDTLQDQLYLLTVLPQVVTDVVYYNVAGERIETQTDHRGSIAIFEQYGISGEIRLRSEYNGKLYAGTVHSGSLLTGESGLGLYPMNNFRLRPVSDQTFFAFLPDGRPYSGPVATWGGVKRNGVLIPDSIRPEEREAGSGGSFTITMDSTLFGEISPSDELVFVYEVHFLSGNWAPMLIEVNGFANPEENVRLGNAILHLHSWDGDGFASIRHTYDDSIDEFDVTNNNSFVGPNSHDPDGILSAMLVSNGSIPLRGLRYMDQFGSVPVGQRLELINDTFSFLSGAYHFFNLELPVDERLRMQAGDVRSFAVLAYDSLGILHRNELPFDILNLVGVEIPEDFHSLGFDLSEIMSDAGIFGQVLGPATQVAIDLMNNLAPTTMSLPMPDNLPFAVNINRSRENPLLFEVKGYLRHISRTWSPEDRETDLTRHGVVYWLNTEYAYRFHASNGCWALRQSDARPQRSQVSEVGPAGSRAPAQYRNNTRRRCNHSDCVAKWRAREAEFNTGFEQAQRRKTEATMTTSRSASAGVEGYFRAEIGWCIETNEFVFDFTRVSVTVDLAAAFGKSFRVKYMAGPVPITMVFTFNAGIGAEINVLLEPSRMINQGFGNRDWLTVRANTRGSISVTASAGVEAVIVSAGVHARAALNLRADMFTQPLVPNFAHRIYVGTEISIGAFVRVGPPWPGFLNWTWRPVFWEFEREWLVAEGQRGNWQGQDPWSNVRAVGGMVQEPVALTAVLFNELVEQRLHNIPNPPTSEPSISVWDENFAVAAWSSMIVAEEYLEEMQRTRQNQGLPAFGEDNIEASDMIGLANLMNVIASVWDGTSWSEPQAVTMNTVASYRPVVAVQSNGTAVIAFQQITFEEITVENDFVVYSFNSYGEVVDREVVMQAGDVAPSVGSIELVYSVLQGNYWTAPQNAEISINGMINDHSVAINRVGDVAIVASVVVQGETDEDFFDGVYAIHIANNGQVTQNRVLTGGDVNISTQVESLSAAFGDGFMFTYFTACSDGFGNVMAGRIAGDGSIAHDFRVSAEIPTPEYSLFTDGSEIVIAWPSYDVVVGGFGITAVKLTNCDGDVGFSAPVTVLQPVADADVNILDGAVETIAGVTSIRILYEHPLPDVGSVKNLERWEQYEDVSETNARNIRTFSHEQRIRSDQFYINQHAAIASAQFANIAIYELGFDVADLAPGQEIPIFIDVANAGVRNITSVVLELNGERSVVFAGAVGENIRPSQIYAGYALTTLGASIANIPYVLTVSFSNGEEYVSQGMVNVALSDISIGGATITLAEEGMREFALNLFNTSNLPLAGSGNSVRLRFYHDPSLLLPASVTWLGLASPIVSLSSPHIVTISEDELLSWADSGSLSLLFRYYVEEDDLTIYGEIASGKRLFVFAEIIDSMGNVVGETDYSANHASVVIESLMRPNLPSVITTVERFDSARGTVDVSLRNLSMQDVPSYSGKMIAVLMSDTGSVVETYAFVIDDTLYRESTFDYHVAFSGRGSDVAIQFIELGTDSTLSNLTLSEIPFVFDNTIVSAGGATTIYVENVHGIGQTTLLAIASNPVAVISVNGSYTGLASITVPLDEPRVAVDMLVTVAGVSTRYTLVITSDVDPHVPAGNNQARTRTLRTVVRPAGLPAQMETVRLYAETINAHVAMAQPLEVSLGRVRVVLPVAVLEELQPRAEHGIVEIRVGAVFCEPTCEYACFGRVIVYIVIDDENISSFENYYAIYMHLEGVSGLNISRLTAIHDNRNIGGDYDTDTSWFGFATKQTGSFYAAYVDNLIRMMLEVDSARLVDMITGEQHIMDVSPIIEDGRTLVPVRFIAEGLGAYVSWDDVTREVAILLDNHQIVLTIGQLMNGMEVPAQLVNDRTMVPLRFVSEKLGATVHWDEKTRNIEVIL